MEMGEHIDTITATLAMFVEVGKMNLPLITWEPDTDIFQVYRLSDSLKSMEPPTSSTYPRSRPFSQQ